MITVVGSLNMDLCVETSRLPHPGETVLGHRYRQAPGGKGANQACALARLGVPVQLIGCVGADGFGREMTANLSAFGVRTGALISKPDAPSGVAFILIDDDGENQIVVCGGANAALRAEDVRKQAEFIARSRAVIAQLEIPLEAVEAAFLIGREAGALTILNPAPAQPLSVALLNLCDWIIPNEREAVQLLDPSLNERYEPSRLSGLLRARAPGCGVVITLGPNGAWLDHKNISSFIPSIPVEAIDTVGAGDAFVGAFVARLTEGADAREAVEFAAAAAAVAVTRPGAQAGLPTRAEAEALLRKM